MDPDGVYYGNHHRPPPEPSAPPIDQECLLSAPRTASLDPPEEDMAALTMDHGSSGRRAHNLEPSDLTDDFHDGVINPVAATYAIPSISDTNLDQLPVASAVPIVTDAVDASSVTTKKTAASSSSHISTAPSSNRNTNQKKVSSTRPKERSRAELRLRRQERNQQSALASATRAEPQPPRKEWLETKKERQKKEKERQQKIAEAKKKRAAVDAARKNKKPQVQTEQRDRFLRFDY